MFRAPLSEASANFSYSFGYIIPIKFVSTSLSLEFFIQITNILVQGEV